MAHLDEALASLRSAHQEPSAHDWPWIEQGQAEWLVHAPPSFAGQRQLMVRAIHERLMALSDRLGADAIDWALHAMAQVPREAFICPMIAELAYLPAALDIGLDQVISHPELVAVLAAAVAPRGGHVLDVGTGSGYQAAVLARMADTVTSIEILEGHASLARRRLAAIGATNVEVIHGDAGAPDVLPEDTYDAIVVAAGASAIPAAILRALKVGGRLVMPMGASASEEILVLTEKLSTGTLKQTHLRPARFVPLTGQGGREQSGSMPV
ncbi:MAG: protein-L-isoaspartate O-methyltransferase [Sphingomonadales bacterium]|nr:protein-L-isoaspartate O-methyltransferase [Sphingomonadales bacterium]MDE2169773.1 protein-L-isoaspartate O-methyltransferase [Sphingomonadales bacterium]